MSKVFRGVFNVSQHSIGQKVGWWVDEAETVEVNGRQMVELSGMYFPMDGRRWHKSRQAALAAAATELREFSAELLVKADEMEASP